MNINEIINGYKILSEIQKYENIFDVIKIGHLEKVSSDIMAYCMNSNVDLSLKNAFIQALLVEANINIPSPYFSIIADTDVYTEGGKTIDLVIMINENELLVVENRIYRLLDNDLQDYISSINNSPKYKKFKKHFLLLSLREIQNNKTNFKNIIHYNLCKRIISIYDGISTKQNALSTLAIDYCNNVINISGQGKRMNNADYEFTEKYYNSVLDIVETMKTYSKYSKNKIIELNNYYETNRDFYKNIINAGTYFEENNFDNQFRAIHFFEFLHNGHTYVLDIDYQVDGWSMIVFCRERKNIDIAYVEYSTDNNGIWMGDDEDKRYKIKKPSISKDEICENIMKIIFGLIERFTEK